MVSPESVLMLIRSWQSGDVYSNVVVVQHDPDLVTPGDAAFALECDFSRPRDLSVNADFKARDR